MPLVFAPIYFIEEEAGQLFSDIAIAISASILVSMLVAITVIPSALARLPVLKQQEPGQLDGLTRFGVAFKSRVLAMVETLVASPVRAGIAAARPAEYTPQVVRVGMK